MGEKDAQRMGELCPVSVDEHLVAGRTLKTACGAQWITKTSSGVNAWEECERTSSSMEFEIAIRVGAPGVVASAGKGMWNANGTGSSSCCTHLQHGESGVLWLAITPTLVFSLFTIASSPSRETFAGRLTAGARGCPSSSLTNCTTMCGDGFGASGSGAGTPW